MRAHANGEGGRLPGVPEPTDEQRRAVQAAEREIRAARRARERAQEQERAAAVRLGRALAAAPRGRGPGKITTARLAELAGIESRAGFYHLVERAEAGEGEAPASNLTGSDRSERKRGKR